jgi:hypothetical protein
MDTSKVAHGTHLEYDKAGAPLYTGQIDLLDEYVERAWDLFHGRVDGRRRRITSHYTDPLKIRMPRRGVRGRAFLKARSLHHQDRRWRHNG